MEKEIVENIALLGNDRHLKAEGWARRAYWQYSRKALHTSSLRIKEWDYYQVMNSQKGYAINFTFSYLGLFSLVSISYVDLERRSFSQESAIRMLTRNRSGLVESPDSDYFVTYANENITLSIIKKGEKRQIIANAPKMVLPDGKHGLIADLTIIDTGCESLNIATSWKEDRRKFYYNEKRGPMRTEGRIIRGLEAEEVNSSYALLDWGRGVWLRNSTWLWSAVMGSDGAIPYMINLGGGFTDRSPASENAIIYGGIVNKIEEIEIRYPDPIDSGKWVIDEKNGRLHLEMEALVNRKDHQDYKIIASRQDQVFGLFSGYFILSDGKKVNIDHVAGFAERVENKW